MRHIRHKWNHVINAAHTIMSFINKQTNKQTHTWWSLQAQVQWQRKPWDVGAVAETVPSSLCCDEWAPHGRCCPALPLLFPAQTPTVLLPVWDDYVDLHSEDKRQEDQTDVTLFLNLFFQQYTAAHLRTDFHSSHKTLLDHNSSWRGSDGERIIFLTSHSNAPSL